MHDQVSDRRAAPAVESTDSALTDVPLTHRVPFIDEPVGERTSRRKRRWVIAAVVVLVLLAAGGVSLITRPSPKPPATLTSVPETDAPFPYKTASDIVSYADHVAVVTAVSEVEARWPSTSTDAAKEQGEPTLPARVTFRVDDVLWSRQGAPQAPSRFTSLWPAWLAKNHQRIAFMGMPVIFVKARYLVPIAYDGHTFSVLQSLAVFRFDRGAVGVKENDHTPLAASLSGASLHKVSSIFANAVPDPLAVRYADLLPRQRLSAVIAARAN